MSDNQKYYYLRLKEDFFDSDELIFIESMPDGVLYSNILLKLYLRSLRSNGKLMLRDRIPYNSVILANMVKQPVSVLESALKIFQQMGLAEILDNGAIYMSDIQNFIGKASTEADRKRNYRAQIESEKKLLGQMSQENRDKCPTNVGETSDECRTNVHERLENRDRTRDKDIESSCSCSNNNIYNNARAREQTTTTTQVNQELTHDVAAAVDEKKSAILDNDAVALWNSNMGLITPILAEQILDLVSEVGYAAYERAVTKALRGNVRNFNYVSKAARGIASGDDYDLKPQVQALRGNVRNNAEQGMSRLQEIARGGL